MGSLRIQYPDPLGERLFGEELLAHDGVELVERQPHVHAHHLLLLHGEHVLQQAVQVSERPLQYLQQAIGDM